MADGCPAAAPGAGRAARWDFSARAWVKTAGAEVHADFARLPDGRTSVILPSGRQLAGRCELSVLDAQRQ